MKVHLLDPASDFHPVGALSPLEEDVVQDPQLDRLWDAMGGGDDYVRAEARDALLQPTTDAQVIRYQQEAAVDADRNQDVVGALNGIAIAALEQRRRVFRMPMHHHPQLELYRATELLGKLVDDLDELRKWPPILEERFTSAAFLGLAATIAAELDDAYMAELRALLRELEFPSGLLMSAGSDEAGRLKAQVLRSPNLENRRFFDRTPLKRPFYAFSLPERDQHGADILSELRDRSVNEVANAATQATEHVLALFLRRCDESSASI